MRNKAVNSKVYANAGNEDVLRHIQSQPSEILDVGCGAGDNARVLVGLGHVVDGVTLSNEEATQAKSVCRRVYIHNLESGLPDEVNQNQYKFVICSHVLEHICFPEKLLAAIHNCLLPDGTLVVALPNLMFIRNRWNLLKGRFDYKESGLMDNTHFRWYTFITSAELLEGSKFTLSEHYATGFIPLGILRRILPNAAGILDRWLCRLWPGLFGIQIVLVCRKG